jgi:hypothetical protein
METIMKTLKIFLVALFGLVALSSCQKDVIPDPAPQTMNDLVISNNFNWKTTADYTLTVQGPISRVISVTSDEGAVYKKGMLMANQSLVVNLTLPSYQKTISLRYNGQVIVLPLSSNSLTYSFK